MLRFPTQTPSVPSSFRNKRVKTIGKGLNQFRNRNIKLPAAIPQQIMRPVRENSQMFITEEGVVVRSFAPFNVKRWNAIPDAEKTKLIEEMEKSFVINEEEHTKKAILQEMGRFYRQHKYRLHKHFLKYETMTEAIANKPKGIKDNEWWFLCEHFSNPKFKERSCRNKDNRRARKTNHCSGTKSFARVSKDLEASEGTHVDRIQLWYKTHYNKKSKKWVDATFEDIYNKLVEAKLQSDCEGGTPMTIDEIFDAVVPSRSGYVQGSSPGPKPNSRANAAEKLKRKEVEDRAMTVEKLNAEFLEEVAQLKARQEIFERNVIQKLHDEVTRHFEQSGHVSLPSWMDTEAGTSHGT